MPTFSGTLNQNVIQSALFNMIISQDVIGGQINDNYNLVDKARVDGSMYGDTKLYIDVPTTVSVEWNQDYDDEDLNNVLATHKPGAPKTQALTFGTYRQARLTKDDYLSKNAFGTEGAFRNYQSIISSRLGKAKEMYDTLTYNAFFGTVQGQVNNIEVPLTDISETGVEKTRLEAEMIAQAIADLIADMKDYNTKYTKNGFIRAFSEDSIGVVWNVKYLNKIRKISLPNIYHNENLIDKFGGDSLPSRMFGDIVESDVATAAKQSGVVYRALTEQIGDNSGTHYWPGDALKTADTAIANKSYIEDEDVICKLYTKLPPYMSAFTASTEFFNPKSLLTNMYLTWGHNNLEALDSEAIVTVHAD